MTLSALAVVVKAISKKSGRYTMIVVRKECFEQSPESEDCLKVVKVEGGKRLKNQTKNSYCATLVSRLKSGDLGDEVESVRSIRIEMCALHH